MEIQKMNLGEHWKKEMMTLPKEFIISMLKQELEEKYHEGYKHKMAG